jgi:hypothetical protein
MIKNHDIVEVAGELRRTTEKAVLFFDGTKEVWLPKAVCEWDSHGKVMQMPEWIALEKGLI